MHNLIYRNDYYLNRNLDEIKRFGDVIDEGEGSIVPDEKTLQIDEEWNQFYHEYLANNK